MSDPYEQHRRSQRDFGITESGAETLANHVVDKLVDRLTDEESVNRIAEVWSRQLDRHIGKTIRRGAYTILLAVLIVVGLRYQAVIDWLSSK